MNKRAKDVSELKLKKNLIGQIAELFTKRFELVVLVVVMLLALGISSIFLLPKESLPEIVFPTLTIQTVYPGANPQDVESLVTVPIEKKMNSLDDVTEVVSNSNYGFSFITVSFDESVDIGEKKIQLDNALADVSLPEGAFDPVSSTFNTSELPLINISLTGDYSITELTGFADTLSSELSRINGVEEVRIEGGANREIQVALDSEKLAEAGLTSNDVSAALKNNNLSFPLGDIEIESTQYSLRVDETLNSVSDIENTVVANNLGETYTVADLGTVSDTLSVVSGSGRSFTKDSGLNNAIFLSVIRKNRSDVVGTSDSVKEVTRNSVGTILPSDVNAVIGNDTAVNVRDDLNSIQSNALSGLIVVVLVLFLFIGFRESLIVSITIPLTLLTTLGLLGFFGITLNTFAILGLIVALGLLVDNTIIVMENMDRLKAKGLSPTDAAVYGTNQVGLPITSATLTTVAAFFPLAILPGIIGAFINTIPRTIIIALLTSLVLAIVITPAVYNFVYKRAKERTLTKKQTLLVNIAKIVFVGVLSIVAFYGEDVFIGVPIIAALFFMTAMFIKAIRKGKSSKKLLYKYRAFIVGITKSRLKSAAVLMTAVIILVSSVTLISSGRLKIAFFISRKELLKK